MKTSIILLTYNKLDYTKECIESIRRYTDLNSYEIIIVDNASTDGTVDWLKQQSDIKTIFNEENVGFPKGCNQGIDLSTGENILFLNNDVIVTKNWLTNLLTCLHSSEQIGAVGPVTNSAAYYSTIPIQYRNIREMHNFAAQHNKSNQRMWKERLKLIGFCMLIKRDVVDKIGLMDERFSPGNFEDDDYSLRIRQAGYKLMLCSDTFIHHYGSISWKDDLTSYNSVITENELKFKEKWGTNSSSYIIYEELIKLINFPLEKEMNVLHIGCKSGGTLLEVKNTFINANIYGIETNDEEFKEVSQIAIVFKTISDIKNIQFDALLFTEDEYQFTEELAVQLLSLLKDDGIFLGIYLNIGHYKVIQKILSGHQPMKQNTHFYSIAQLDQIFNVVNIRKSITGLTNLISNDDKNFIAFFEKMKGNKINTLLSSNAFIVKAEKINQILFSLLKQINAKEEISAELTLLNEYEIDEICELIELKFNKPIELTQKIGINNYYLNNHDFVLPYLQKAYELDSTNTDTLYNISYVLFSYGEYRLAYDYIVRINKSDANIDELRKVIKSKTIVDYRENNDIVIKNDIESLELEVTEQNDVQFTGERIVINRW